MFFDRTKLVAAQMSSPNFLAYKLTLIFPGTVFSSLLFISCSTSIPVNIGYSIVKLPLDVEQYIHRSSHSRCLFQI